MDSTSPRTPGDLIPFDQHDATVAILVIVAFIVLVSFLIACYSATRRSHTRTRYGR